MARELMPIMGSKLLKAMPMAMLVAHEAQAQKNHGQSLARLAQRGGLHPSEVLCIALGYGWGALKECDHNEAILLQNIARYLQERFHED